MSTQMSTRMGEDYAQSGILANCAHDCRTRCEAGRWWGRSLYVPVTFEHEPRRTQSQIEVKSCTLC